MTKTHVTPVFMQKHRSHFSKHSGYFLSKHWYSPVNGNDVSYKRNGTKSSYVAGWTVGLRGPVRLVNATQPTEHGTKTIWALLSALSLPNEQLQQFFTGKSHLFCAPFPPLQNGNNSIFLYKAPYDQQVKTYTQLIQAYFIQRVKLSLRNLICIIHAWKMQEEDTLALRCYNCSSLLFPAAAVAYFVDRLQYRWC